MTNEQLAIMLQAYWRQLETAIKGAEGMLPADAERFKRWQYKGGNPLAAVVSSPETHPKLWMQVDGDAVCLEPFRDMLETVGQNVTTLCPLLAVQEGSDGED